VTGGSTGSQEAVLWEVFKGKKRVRGGTSVDKGRSDQIPGAERVIPGSRVSNSRIFGVEYSGRDGSSVRRKEGQRTTLWGAHGGVELPALGGTSSVRKKVLRSSGSISLLRRPESNVVIGRTSQKAIRGRMYGQRFNTGLVAVQIQLRRNLSNKVIILRILPQPNSAVQASGSDLVRRDELGGLDGRSMSSLGGSWRGGNSLR
jgi:hypothetical protein